MPKVRWPTLVALTAALTACTTATTPSALEPRGPAAANIEALWWLLFWLGLLAFAIFCAFLIFGLLRRRSRAFGNRLIIGGGLLLTVPILAIVFVATVATMRRLNVSTPDPFTVEVTGYRWWWDVRYPQYGVVSANEIHIPVGRPVRLVLRSADVIHSVWIPELHGKKDMIPGSVNELWIEADEARQYWSICAEFCGVQHAKMFFIVVAHEPDDFAAWLQQAQQTPPPPATVSAQQGQRVYDEAECGFCHAIAGAETSGEQGPDLTHLASRLTLGAGVLPNTRDNLAAWIRDPHDAKPFNLMPATQLSEAELAALLDYLETLK